MTRALTARPPRSEKVLPAWLWTIARRRAIKWLEKRKRRAKYEGPMPTHAPREDAYTGAVDPDDAEPAEHAYDPQADDELGELLGSALDRFIGGDNRRDRETRDMIRESAEDKKTYAQIAKERKTTEAAVAKRIQRFKEKYADRVKRRNRMMLWLKIGGGALAFVVAAIIAYFVLRPPPPAPIGPDPSQVHPSPPRPAPTSRAHPALGVRLRRPAPARRRQEVAGEKPPGGERERQVRQVKRGAGSREPRLVLASSNPLFYLATLASPSPPGGSSRTATRRRRVIDALLPRASPSGLFGRLLLEHVPPMPQSAAQTVLRAEWRGA